MFCKCTCGGCDCQLKVRMFTDFAAAAGVAKGVPIQAYRWAAAANVANPLIVNVHYDAGCAVAPPVFFQNLVH